MGVLWCFLILMLSFYVCSISYELIYMNAGHFVPAVLSCLVSLIVFFFTMVKAGPVLFDQSAYEKQAALPVSASAIIISRFLSMYFTDMLLGIFIMLPGMAVYGVMEKPPFTFYLYGLIGSLFLPLLPLTAASVIGALIAGISSRWKRKNLVTIVLTLVLVCAFLISSFRTYEIEESQLEEMLQQISLTLEIQLQSAYPPALWLSKALVYGQLHFLLLFLAVSLGSFLLFLGALRPFYGKICSLLGVNEAKRDYKMKELRARSVLASMVERELFRYFSSPIYVTNTLIGELMMVITAAAILIMGKEAIDNLLGISGIAEKALPILLGMMPAMMPTTACSISLEGKQWWLMQTLPVTKKDILRSKIGMNLLIAAPFYLVSELLLLIALKPAGLNILYLLLVPAVYILFSACAGIAVNLKFPVFDWESEVKVVKQSTAGFLAVLIDILAGTAPLGVLICFQNLPASIVYLAVIGSMAAILCGLRISLFKN